MTIQTVTDRLSTTFAPGVKHRLAPAALLLILVVSCASPADPGPLVAPRTERWLLSQPSAGSFVPDERLVVGTDGAVVRETYTMTGVRTPQYDEKYMLSFNQTNTWVLDMTHSYDTGSGAWVAPDGYVNHYKFHGLYTNQRFLSTYAMRKITGPATGVDGLWFVARDSWETGTAFPAQGTNLRFLAVSGENAAATNYYASDASGFFEDGVRACTNFAHLGGGVYRFIHWNGAADALTNYYRLENGFLFLTNAGEVYVRE